MTNGGRRGGFNQPACGALCSSLSQCSTLTVAPPSLLLTIVCLICSFKRSCVGNVLSDLATGCFRMERNHRHAANVMTRGKSYLQPVASHLMKAATIHKREAAKSNEAAETSLICVAMAVGCAESSKRRRRRHCAEHTTSSARRNGKSLSPLSVFSAFASRTGSSLHVSHRR